MRKTLVIAVIVGLVTLAAGYAIGMKLGSDNTSAGYDKKLEQIKSSFLSQGDMKVVSGTVKSVNGNTLTVETMNLGSFLEGTPQVREVTAGSNTKITRQEPMDQAELQKLREPYQKLGYSFSMPFRQVDAKISDIKAGNHVTVTANQNIKMEKAFEAATIVVLMSTVSVPSTVPAPKAQ